MTIGLGMGQVNRVDAVEQSLGRALKHHRITENTILISDAFFPFADGLLQAAEAGATAIIQPGGSIKDDEIIRAADDAGLAMIFTGIRHFRH